MRETYPGSKVYVAETADDVQQMLEWRDYQALLRVARAAQYADDVLDRITQSFPDNEVPHPSIEECLNAYCNLNKALKDLPEHLLEVVK